MCRPGPGIVIEPTYVRGQCFWTHRLLCESLKVLPITLTWLRLQPIPQLTPVMAVMAVMAKSAEGKSHKVGTVKGAALAPPLA